MPKSQKNSKIAIKFTVALFAFFLLVLPLSGCGTVGASGTQRFSETALLLDTVVSVTYYDAEDTAAVQSAMKLCRDYELIFSRTDPESELFRLNESGSMPVSDELLTVLKTALEYCALTGGSFDVTMGGVSALYGFSSEHPSAPDDAALGEALSHVGYENVTLDGSTVTLDDPEAVIDLGAVAKGYIADRMKEFLLANGVEHAIIDLGGNVLCLGAKPDGSDYRVGIRDPQAGAVSPIVTVSVNGGSVVTSGVYERSFTENGVTYHHILDSATGRSVQNGLLSVSILGPESLQCDALSTVCFALGLEDGMAFIESLDGYEALFITDDMALHSSGGFEHSLVK